MTLSLDEISAFLSDSVLTRVENEIAAAVGLPVCREDISLFVPLLKQEIEVSGMQLAEIACLLKEFEGSVVTFGISLLRAEEEHRDPSVIEEEGLASGFGVSYAIYFFYLQNKSVQDFVEYVEARRIPKAKSFVGRLKKAYDGLSLTKQQ